MAILFHSFKQRTRCETSLLGTGDGNAALDQRRVRRGMKRMQGPPTPTCHWWACDCHRPGAKDEPKMQTWDNMNEAALLHGVCASCLPSHWRVCELLTCTLRTARGRGTDCHRLGSAAARGRTQCPYPQFTEALQQQAQGQSWPAGPGLRPTGCLTAARPEKESQITSDSDWAASNVSARMPKLAYGRRWAMLVL